jgi:hypothetical protein
MEILHAVMQNLLDAVDKCDALFINTSLVFKSSFSTAGEFASLNSRDMLTGKQLEVFNDLKKERQVWSDRRRRDLEHIPSTSGRRGSAPPTARFTGKCNSCGRVGHMAKDCYANKGAKKK